MLAIAILVMALGGYKKQHLRTKKKSPVIVKIQRIVGCGTTGLILRRVDNLLNSFEIRFEIFS
jgi:hypothetical protein